MQPSDKIKLYRTLFRGRNYVFARRWNKNGSYFPDYTFDWNEFNAHKSSGGTIKNFKNKQLTPLNDEVVRKHLSGQITIGIYPILEDNTSYFLAADFDREHWIKDCRNYQDEMAKIGLLAYIERSRSGNGSYITV